MRVLLTGFILSLCLIPSAGFSQGQAPSPQGLPIGYSGLIVTTQSDGSEDTTEQEGTINLLGPIKGTLKVTFKIVLSNLCTKPKTLKFAIPALGVKSNLKALKDNPECQFVYLLKKRITQRKLIANAGNSLPVTLTPYFKIGRKTLKAENINFQVVVDVEKPRTDAEMWELAKAAILELNTADAYSLHNTVKKSFGKRKSSVEPAVWAPLAKSDFDNNGVISRADINYLTSAYEQMIPKNVRLALINSDINSDGNITPGEPGQIPAFILGAVTTTKAGVAEEVWGPLAKFDVDEDEVIGSSDYLTHLDIANSWLHL